MASPLLVHVHRGLRERLRDVAHAAGVVEMDVGDGDAGQVFGPDAEVVERGEQHGDRALAARLDEHRGIALDEVAGGHALPAPEQRVDLDDAVTDARVHVVLPAVANGQYGGTP